MVFFGLAVVPFVPTSKLVQGNQEPSLRFRCGKCVVHERKKCSDNTELQQHSLLSSPKSLSPFSYYPGCTNIVEIMARQRRHRLCVEGHPIRDKKAQVLPCQT
jgi:hypothetical protein